MISLCLLVCFKSFSQRSLSIGEKVPDILMSYNQSGKNLNTRFSDLKGKLVVLDFWGVNCPPCIKAFGKLDTLQKKFENQIQIILITSTSKKEIDSIFLKRSQRSSAYHLPNLPSITGDTIFHRLFRHVLIPHIVWIDQDGKVSQITEDDFLTSANISKLLQDNAVKFPRKHDLLNYDPKKAMVPEIIKSEPEKLKFYSAIIKWIPGLWGGTSRVNINTVNQTVRMTRGFHSMLALYSDALSEFSAYDDPYKHPYFDFGKRVVLEINDSNRYFFNLQKGISLEEWRGANFYAYEIVLPLAEKHRAYEYMLSDLNRFFQINGRIEKRKMKCLALVRTSMVDKIKYSGTRDLSLGRFYFDSSGAFHLFATRMNSFRDKLSEYNQDKRYAFTDHTNYHGLIELDIESSLNDIVSLKKELLLKYDLDLIETEEEISVMVLTERSFNKRVEVKE